MDLEEVYLGLGLAFLPPLIQNILLDHRVSMIMVITEVDIGLTLAIFFAYNHRGINFSHPRFPQEAITKGVQGENIHQNHPYYYYPIMPTHLNPRMPQNPHHKIPPHLYPSIPPHHIFVSILHLYSYVCTLCTSTLPPYSILRLSIYIIWKTTLLCVAS